MSLFFFFFYKTKQNGEQEDKTGLAYGVDTIGSGEDTRKEYKGV
jgi:hypothetical protein